MLHDTHRYFKYILYQPMITNITSWAQGMQKDNFTCLQLFSKLWPIAKKKESLLAQISGAVATITYISPKMCYRIYYRHRRCSGKWVSMVSDTFLSYVARNYVLIPYLPCYFISFILMKHKYITVKLQRLSRDTEYRNHCIICTCIHAP